MFRSISDLSTFILILLFIPIKDVSEEKADPDLTQDIAYIYEILHSNHFIILSNATEYETTTINRCPSTVVVSGWYTE